MADRASVSAAEGDLSRAPRVEVGAIQKVEIGGQFYSVDHAQLTSIGRGPHHDPALAPVGFAFYGIEPMQRGTILSVAADSKQACNCFTYSDFAPQLHTTHLEMRSHLLADSTAQPFLARAYVARLITVHPALVNGGGLSLVPEDGIENQVILREDVEHALRGGPVPEVVILRTPNFEGKRECKYQNNAPFPHHEVAQLLVELGVKHVVFDLPSADRAVDLVLPFHRTFWQDPIKNGERVPGLDHVPNQPREESAIVELAYIPDEVSDGWHLLYLFPISWPDDARPIAPMIAPILDFPGNAGC